MCGIVGIFDPDNHDLKHDLIAGMTYIQHRGQDSAGISIVNHAGKIQTCKGMGLVSNVFSNKIDNLLRETIMGLGHVRYSTQGTLTVEEAQPLYTSHPFGLSLVHNGNITNIQELQTYLTMWHRHTNTNSDSEILLHVVATELDDNFSDILTTIGRVMKLLKGSYSVLLTISGVGMVAFRDPRGIRPLCYGMSDSNGYMFVSESVALTGTNYTYVRDVSPGECIFISLDGKFHCKIVAENPIRTPCLFEYIYFARPDSVIDGISVYKAREKMGEYLGTKILGNFFGNAQTVSERRALLSNKYRKTVTDIDVTDIDVVIPVPETSRTYAICLAELLGIPYREGFIKNRYIARTFIMSNHQDHNHRSKMVKMKLNTIASEFKDKNVLIVDDSIVRGTTSRELVRLAKEAGAKKIWFASAAPPIRYPNYLGIDIPRQNELIAHNKTEEEIATILGCDRVFYNNLKDICDGLLELASEYGILLDGFEVSCFAEQNASFAERPSDATQNSDSLSRIPKDGKAVQG